MDFTSLGGPSINNSPLNPNEIILFPGWIPLSLDKNTSNEEILIIGGNLD